ncbi:thiolase [Meredithblackwellia eburnea MCA 4105]
MQRISQITNHFTGKPTGVAALQVKTPDDVVVVMAKRAPLCKAHKGGFKDMRTDELLIATLKATIDNLPIPVEMIEDIAVGSVTADLNESRAAAIAAGIPVTTSMSCINRFCSSGLMALSNISNQIRNNEIECGLAVGIEHITDMAAPRRDLCDQSAAHPVAVDVPKPMGWTSENVGKDFAIPRETMDKFAARSHQRADNAQKTGIFAEEIIPVEALVREPGAPKDAPRKKVILSKDDGIRSGTTAESLAKVRPAFPQWGPLTTGGNASQLTDGAAVTLLMKRSKAEALGLKILGKHVNTVVTGLDPRIMGIGPYYAIPKVLEKVGITKDDVDLWEINEAFATMYVFCVERLGLDLEKVNVNGGAIGVGHPFGMTGVRQVVTGLPELNRRKGKILVTSMCIGSGMGAAAVWVAE